METDFASQRLHDRATRGESLTETEREQLAVWYARQDAEETAMLTAMLTVPASDARLLATTQRIHALTEENNALRQDIAALTQRLARTAVPQTV